MKNILLLAIVTFFTMFTITCSTQKNYDVVIYGGTSAGVAAAIQASRMDKSVVLVEPGNHLGGLTSGGLGKTDSGNKEVIGGISREFYQRLKKYYDNPAMWKQEKQADFSEYKPEEDAIWRFEPSVAEQTYEHMIKEEKIKVVKNERLDLDNGVVMENHRIVSIQMESGKIYLGKMFIDATYEGDLMARADVSYTVGRESNEVYGETLNGVQTAMAKYHQLVDGVDPYIIPGGPKSGLLPGIQTDGPGEEGSGDKRIQAYCFRMCLTDDEENKIPIEKPAGYDSLRYELLLRNYEAGEDGMPWIHSLMPNRKTDINNRLGVSTDNIGQNYNYAEADYETRDKIIQEHEQYQKGLMWTMANHPRMPREISSIIGQWGLCKDEFTDNGNWPHQLYVREARRMVSDYVVTENDCKRKVIVEDPVGLGSYNMDSHHVQRYVTKEGWVKNEGDVEVSPGGAYLISYRSIVPKKGEAENLLVPVCLSASHIAYGSIRMEPVFMILGQSAATAAILAIDNNVAVQNVDYGKLSTQLLKDRQVLDLPLSDQP